MESKPKNCLITNCQKPMQSRGLCLNHYAYASYRIYKGVIQSWEELEKKGLAFPLKSRMNILFEKAFKKK